QLRRGQDERLRRYLGTLYRLRDLRPGDQMPLRAQDVKALVEALGREPAAIESRLVKELGVSADEAARLRAALLAPPPGHLGRRRGWRAPPSGRRRAPYEELSRLPEPAPLPAPDHEMPDLFAAPAVELLDDLPMEPVPLLEEPEDRP